MLKLYQEYLFMECKAMYFYWQAHKMLKNNYF